MSLEVTRQRTITLYDSVGGQLTVCEHHESVVASVCEPNQTSRESVAQADVVLNRDNAQALVTYLTDVFDLNLR